MNPIKLLYCLWKGHQWGGSGWGKPVNDFLPNYWKCYRCKLYLTTWIHSKLIEWLWKNRPTNWDSFIMPSARALRDEKKILERTKK